MSRTYGASGLAPNERSAIGTQVWPSRLNACLTPGCEGSSHDRTVLFDVLVDDRRDVLGADVAEHAQDATLSALFSRDHVSHHLAEVVLDRANCGSCLASSDRVLVSLQDDPNRLVA